MFYYDYDRKSKIEDILENTLVSAWWAESTATDGKGSPYLDKLEMALGLMGSTFLPEYPQPEEGIADKLDMHRANIKRNLCRQAASKRAFKQRQTMTKKYIQNWSV